MTNQYEAIASALQAVNRAEKAVNDLTADVFDKARAYLKELEDRLPPAEEVDVNSPTSDVPGPTDENDPVSEDEPSVGEMLEAIRQSAREAVGKSRTGWDQYEPDGPLSEAFVRVLYKRIAKNGFRWKP